MPGAIPLPGSQVSAASLRAAATAAATASDLIDRWSINYGGTGVGLYHGTWGYTGDRVTRFSLHDIRLTRDLAVSGTVVWWRYARTITVNLAIKEVTALGPDPRLASARDCLGRPRTRWRQRDRAGNLGQSRRRGAGLAPRDPRRQAARRPAARSLTPVTPSVPDGGLIVDPRGHRPGMPYSAACLVLGATS